MNNLNTNHIHTINHDKKNAQTRSFENVSDEKYLKKITIICTCTRWMNAKQTNTNGVQNPQNPSMNLSGINGDSITSIINKVRQQLKFKTTNN